MDSEGGDSNSPTFHGMDFEGADLNSPTFHGVYPGLLVAPIGPPELGAGAGLPNIPIDPPAFEAGAEVGPIVAPVGLPVLVAEIDGGFLGPIGPLGFGIHAGLLGPPIDGVYPGLLVVPISQPELEAGANAGPLIAPFGPSMLGQEMYCIPYSETQRGLRWGNMVRT